MRKTIAILAALALASSALPAFAASHDAKSHKKQVASVSDLVTQYATQIAGATSTQITLALSAIAAPSTTFDAAGWAAKITPLTGSALIATTVDAVNAAIAAHQAAVGSNYVVMTKSFYDQALAAKLSGKTP